MYQMSRLKVISFDTGKICLGGGVHCPSASSLYIYLYISAF